MYAQVAKPSCFCILLPPLWIQTMMMGNLLTIRLNFVLFCKSICFCLPFCRQRGPLVGELTWFVIKSYDISQLCRTCLWMSFTSCRFIRRWARIGLLGKRDQDPSHWPAFSWWKCCLALSQVVYCWDTFNPDIYPALALPWTAWKPCRKPCPNLGDFTKETGWNIYPCATLTFCDQDHYCPHSATLAVHFALSKGNVWPILLLDAYFTWCRSWAHCHTHPSSNHGRN